MNWTVFKVNIFCNKEKDRRNLITLTYIFYFSVITILPCVSDYICLYACTFPVGKSYLLEHSKIETNQSFLFILPFELVLKKGSTDYITGRYIQVM